ncbi:MAG: hypothetical protein O7C75_09010 [Verrucomicrobia bacterium]|nr:hypothetical protein [Verrucomicrobiota bacterium]
MQVSRIWHYLLRASYKRTILGIFVRTLVSGREERKTVFTKVEEALLLIKKFDPKRFNQIQSLVRCIFVFGDPTARGKWHQDLQTCEIQEEYVRSPDTAISEIASTIVHEATHARLMRLDIDYQEPKRLRIERICFKAEQAFARRLPDPDRDKLVQQAEQMLTLDKSCFTDAGRRAADLKALRSLRCPRWLVRLLDWWTAHRGS